MLGKSKSHIGATLALERSTTKHNRPTSFEPPASPVYLYPHHRSNAAFCPYHSSTYVCPFQLGHANAALPWFRVAHDHLVAGNTEWGIPSSPFPSACPRWHTKALASTAPPRLGL